MICWILKSHRIESPEHDKKGEDGGIRLKWQGSVKERLKWKSHQRIPRFVPWIFREEMGDRGDFYRILSWFRTFFKYLPDWWLLYYLIQKREMTNITLFLFFLIQVSHGPSKKRERHKFVQKRKDKIKNECILEIWYYGDKLRDTYLRWFRSIQCAS